MESARPHYSESWAPILHAATLWLNAKGFGLKENKNEVKTSNAANNNNSNNNNNDISTNTNVERFHLLFGKYSSVILHIMFHSMILHYILYLFRYMYGSIVQSSCFGVCPKYRNMFKCIVHFIGFYLGS